MATEFKYSPEDFDNYVKAYHKRVENSGEFPDLAGLKNALDIEDEEYDEMSTDPAYHKTILWSRRRRESYLNRLATTAKNTNGIKMLLAQPENGGYVEKPVDKTPRKLEVVLRGMPDDDVDSDDSDDADAVADSDADAAKETGSKARGTDRQSGNLSGKANRSRGRSKRTGA